MKRTASSKKKKKKKKFIWQTIRKEEFYVDFLGYLRCRRRNHYAKKSSGIRSDGDVELLSSVLFPVGPPSKALE
jgi:hypothetical protein